MANKNLGFVGSLAALSIASVNGAVAQTAPSPLYSPISDAMRAEFSKACMTAGGKIVEVVTCDHPTSDLKLSFAAKVGSVVKHPPKGRPYVDIVLVGSPEASPAAPLPPTPAEIEAGLRVQQAALSRAAAAKKQHLSEADCDNSHTSIFGVSTAVTHVTTRTNTQHASFVVDTIPGATTDDMFNADGSLNLAATIPASRPVLNTDHRVEQSCVVGHGESAFSVVTRGVAQVVGATGDLTTGLGVLKSGEADLKNAATAASVAQQDANSRALAAQGYASGVNATRVSINNGSSSSATIPVAGNLTGGTTINATDNAAVNTGAGGTVGAGYQSNNQGGEGSQFANGTSAALGTVTNNTASGQSNAGSPDSRTGDVVTTATNSGSGAANTGAGPTAGDNAAATATQTTTTTGAATGQVDTSPAAPQKMSYHWARSPLQVIRYNIA